MSQPSTAALATLVLLPVLLSVHAAPPEADPLPVDPAGCEPSAPVEIEVLDASVAGGVAFVRYRVESRLDGVRLDSRVAPPAGGAVLSDRGVRVHGVSRGARATGSARVRLPAGASGARLTVEAALTFTASGGELEGEEETAVATRTLTWGTVDPSPDLPLVVSDGVASLDVPATRTGGDNR